MPITPTPRLPLLPLAAAALAIGIFIFDTISPLQFAVAVLYVVVVFMNVCSNSSFTVAEIFCSTGSLA